MVKDPKKDIGVDFPRVDSPMDGSSREKHHPSRKGCNASDGSVGVDGLKWAKTPTGRKHGQSRPG